MAQLALMSVAFVLLLGAMWAVLTSNRRKAQGEDATKLMAAGFALGLAGNLLFVAVLVSSL